MITVDPTQKLEVCPTCGHPLKQHWVVPKLRVLRCELCDCINEAVRIVKDRGEVVDMESGR